MSTMVQECPGVVLNGVSRSDVEELLTIHRGIQCKEMYIMLRIEQMPIMQELSIREKTKNATVESGFASLFSSAREWGWDQREGFYSRYVLSRWCLKFEKIFPALFTHFFSKYYFSNSVNKLIVKRNYVIYIFSFCKTFFAF